ncbi:MAG TPA: radical SAM protein [Thermoplasmatales archaeon]|nr:radical SAM protein [Thermoplasmatales archaeon]
MVNYRWIRCRFLLNRITNRDKLFHGNYTLDPYQKCDLGCRYCDASEDTVYIKSNAFEVLQSEITRFSKGTVIVGSTVDPYQRIERKQKVMPGVLKLLVEHNFPFHILTKSDLVFRDIQVIGESEDAYVTVSVSTMDKEKAKMVEPFAPSPEKRFKILEQLMNQGVSAGVAVMPILPFITEESLGYMMERAKDAGAEYVIYGYLELKGEQRKRFLSTLETHFPEYVNKYKVLYSGSYTPVGYRIDDQIKSYCKSYKLDIGFRKQTCRKN